MAEQPIRKEDIIDVEAIQGIIDDFDKLENAIKKVDERARKLAESMELGGKAGTSEGYANTVKAVQELEPLYKTQHETQVKLKEVEQERNKVLQETAEHFAKTGRVASDLESIYKKTIGTFELNIDRVEQLKSTQKKLRDSTKKLKKEQERLTGEYRELIRAGKDGTKEVEDNIKARKELSTTLTENARGEVLIKEKIIQTNIILRQQSKEINLADGSAQKLQTQLGLMRRAYREMSDEMASSPMGQQFHADIVAVEEQVRTTNESIGNFHDSVGNYAKGFDDYGKSLSMVLVRMKIIPSELGMQVRNFSRLRKVFNFATKATGGLIKSMGALKFALAATGILAFIGLVSVLIVNLMSARDVTQELTDMNDRLNESYEDTIGVMNKMSGLRERDLKRQLKMAEAMGASGEELLELEKKIRQENIDNAQNSIKLGNDRIAQLKQMVAVENARADGLIALNKKMFGASRSDQIASNMGGVADILASRDKFQKMLRDAKINQKELGLTVQEGYDELAILDKNYLKNRNKTVNKEIDLEAERIRKIQEIINGFKIDTDTFLANIEINSLNSGKTIEETAKIVDGARRQELKNTIELLKNYEKEVDVTNEIARIQLELAQLEAKNREAKASEAQKQKTLQMELDLIKLQGQIARQTAKIEGAGTEVTNRMYADRHALLLQQIQDEWELQKLGLEEGSLEYQKAFELHNQKIEEENRRHLKELKDESVNTMEEIAKDSITMFEQSMKGLTTFYDQQVKDITTAQNKIIQSSQSTINALKQSAMAGNEQAKESILAEEKAIEEAQKRIEKAEKQRQRIQMATSLISSFNQKVSSGKTGVQALSEVSAEAVMLQTLISLIPSFAVGADRLSSDGKGIDGKGGFLAVNHPDERIIPAHLNRQIGFDVTNQELAYQMRLNRQNKGINTVYIDNSEMLTRIENGLKNINNWSMDIEQLFSTITIAFEKEKNGVINRYKKDFKA